jgi:Domain of unknown function (DUF1707)
MIPDATGAGAVASTPRTGGLDDGRSRSSQPGVAARGRIALGFPYFALLEVAVMAGTGAGKAPGGAYFLGRFRASDADRERVIDILKVAFVQGRLTRDELDARAGQTFASRTYAELAAVTADIRARPPAAREPAGQTAAWEPARQPATKESAGQTAAREPAGQTAAREPAGTPSAKKFAAWSLGGWAGFSGALLALAFGTNNEALAKVALVLMLCSVMSSVAVVLLAASNQRI